MELWLALHRHQALIKRLERLGVPPEEFREDDRRLASSADARVLAEPRANIREGHRGQPTTTGGPAQDEGIIRVYCGMYRGQLVSYFVLSRVC